MRVTVCDKCGKQGAGTNHQFWLGQYRLTVETRERADPGPHHTPADAPPTKNLDLCKRCMYEILGRAAKATPPTDVVGYRG